eukprot:764027-Hanusia_phi.AAC.4
MLQFHLASPRVFFVWNIKVHSEVNLLCVDNLLSILSGVQGLPLPGHGPKHDPDDAQKDVNDPKYWNWEKLGEMQYLRAQHTSSVTDTSALPSKDVKDAGTQSSLPVKFIRMNRPEK